MREQERLQDGQKGLCQRKKDINISYTPSLPSPYLCKPDNRMHFGIGSAIRLVCPESRKFDTGEVTVSNKSKMSQERYTHPTSLYCHGTVPKLSLHISYRIIRVWQHVECAIVRRQSKDGSREQDATRAREYHEQTSHTIILTCSMARDEYVRES